MEEERRLRRAAEEAMACSETRLGRSRHSLRKRVESSASTAASVRALQLLQAEAATTSSMLSSGLERISAKASSSTPPAPLPISQKYYAGIPALAYGVLKRANDIAIRGPLLSVIELNRRSTHQRHQRVLRPDLEFLDKGGAQ